MTCSAEDCDRPIEKSGLCAGHRKQKQRGQPFTPLAVNRGLPADSPHRLTYHEALVEAALGLADADSEDDAAWARLDDALTDAAMKFAKQAKQAKVGVLVRAAMRYAKHEMSLKIRRGMAKRKDAGLPLGPRPKLSQEQAKAAVETAGGIRAAARSMGVSRDAVRRALRRVA